MTHRAEASHIGSCLSVADILAVLYADDDRVALIKQLDASRDVVIMSKGHAAAALYAALAGVGILDASELVLFCQEGSFLTGHVNHLVSGVEFSTGSLGHGLSLGLGVALGKRLSGSKGRVFCIVSDGEMNEGSFWEAISWAGHTQASSLTLIVDKNEIQSLGATHDVLNLDPLQDKLRNFGWNASTVDGHSYTELDGALSVDSFAERPTAVICRTTKGRGVPRMENRLEWHYRSPSQDDLTSIT